MLFMVGTWLPLSSYLCTVLPPNLDDQFMRFLYIDPPVPGLKTSTWFRQLSNIQHILWYHYRVSISTLLL